MNHILMIEDDKVIATIYRQKLEHAGFSVEICHTGQDGFYRVHEAPFAAVILDLMLPGMSGADFLKKIRAQSRFAQLPVFILTNSFFEDEIAAAHEAGATRIFNKANTSPVVVVEAIKNHLTPGKSHETAAVSAPSVSSAVAKAEPAAPPAREQEEDPLALAAKAIKTASAILPSLSRANEGSTRVTLIIEMLRAVHHFANIAAAIGLGNVARVAFALETLLQRLQERPEYVNPSTLRTIAATLDFISKSFAHPKILPSEGALAVSILAVDDDPVARQTIRKALEKASLKCVVVNTPDLALTLLEENHFDLAILDVEMAGIDGFELCRRIRMSKDNSSVPVLFVTNLNDLQSRTASVLSGGTDFIAKPFLPIELGLKALVHVTKAAGELR